MANDVSIENRILSHPHWRVVLRPDRYDPQAISTLSECRKIVEKNRVSLRGWDSPHFPTSSANPDLHGTLNGKDWIGGWSNFMRQIEYWRFYQSKQFIHLFTVREVREPEWHDKLAETAKSHLSHIRDVNWDAVPGYFAMLNFIYTISEAVEFAARLAQAGVYDDHVTCSIGTHRIQGFVLTPDWRRGWSFMRRATEDSLENEWTLAAESLVADSAKVSLQVCVWFFERLDWDNPNEEAIANDIRNFLDGRA